MIPIMCGTGKADITPGKNLLPMPLLGPLKFTHINDHIFVRSLAFQSGNEKCLIISLELTLVPYAKELIAEISEKIHLARENILLCATHTHQATPLCLPQMFPYTSEETEKCNHWFSNIKEALFTAVEDSLASLKPCKIGYGTGKSYVNCNRDEVKTGEKAEIGFNFERPSDKTLKLVRIEDENGALIAVLVNYACHAVVMNGCIENRGVGISGDLPGRTSAAIESEYPGCVCLWTSGAAGDQNPRMMTNFGIKIVDGKPVYQNLGESGHLVLELLSEEHVRDVKRVLSKINCSLAKGNISCRQSICRCPKTDGEEMEYLCSVLSVGGLLFEGVNGEMPTSIGASIIRSSSADNVLFVTHANGYRGYIPDDWQLEHNSFEAEGVPLRLGCADRKFTETFIKLIQEIQ